MRWGLRQILKMYKIPLPAIRLFDRKELLRVISEGNFPDQTGVEELSSTQMRSAMETMMFWLSERGEFEAGQGVRCTQSEGQALTRLPTVALDCGFVRLCSGCEKRWPLRLGSPGVY
jgi:hypothetical protein